MKKELLNSVGLSYGELSLKGKNRGQFEKLLKNRINKALKGIEYKLTEDLSKLYITGENKDIETIVEKMKKVFGVVGLNPSVKIDRDDDIIKETVTMIAKDAYEKGARDFKVSVNRNDKTFEKKSMDYAKELGAHILINSPFEKVKMKEPDLLINVDIRKNVYIYTERIKTYGGLPTGSTGKGLVLLSGGIDSPVASFMMAKRGMRINFVTFHSFPFTSRQALEKVKELAEILSIYTGKTRLYSMNILKIQEAINSRTEKDLATILTRRVMMKLSEKLSENMEYQALITGESLGQVASQTLGG